MPDNVYEEYRAMPDNIYEEYRAMTDDTPQIPTAPNDKPPPSIREFLASSIGGGRMIRQLCEKHGIDLDSPWPPNFPKGSRQGHLPEPEKTSAEVIHLPMWAEATRGTPNSFLRGALFAAIHGKEREYLKRQILASRDGIKIRFTGMQLDQSDLDVWEEAAELARSHPLGNVCQFSMHGFLKALGRDTGKSQHEWLKEVFSRLMSSGVEITHGRYTYGGSMLEFTHDDKAGIYVLRLNPNILALYKAGWTGIDRETRQKLRRKPLALWLHGYLSSDAENYDTKVETLHRLSGSTTKELFHFKANLKAALADLETATAGRMKGTITGDLVRFECQPTPAQARHLTKKAAKKRNNKPTLAGDLLPPHHRPKK